MGRADVRELTERYDRDAEAYRELWAPVLRTAALPLARELSGTAITHVLDVGTGVGSLLPDLSIIFPDAVVLGVDRSRGMLALAPNRFGRSLMDAQQLGIRSGSVDRVFLVFMLFHLDDPSSGLREARRVLRPGGVVGVRDVDSGGQLFFPPPPLWEQYVALRSRVRQHNGGDPFLGRAHRRLLLDAGFARTEAGASVNSAGSPEETRHEATHQRALLHGIARTALAEGWADQATLDAMAGEFDAWAERPDAFYAAVYCHAVGWVEA